VLTLVHNNKFESVCVFPDRGMSGRKLRVQNRRVCLASL